MPETMAALREKKVGEDESFGAFGLVFAGACRHAGEAEWPELLEIFEKLPPDSWERSFALMPLSDLWLRLNGEKMKFPAPQKLAGEVAKMPDEVAQLPANLQDAARKFRSFVQPVSVSSFVENASFRSFQSNEPAYWKLIGDLLAGRGGDWSRQLQNYGWGGSCGTGSEVLMMPQSRALLIAYLKENRPKEAIKAALTMPQNLLGLGEPSTAPALSILRQAGIDWIQAMTGGLVLADLTKDKESFWFFYQQGEWLDVLSRQGDGEAAELLLEIARRVPAAKREAYLRALANFVEPAKPASPRREAPPISAKVQEKILTFFEEQITDQTSMDELRALTYIYETLERPETKPALRKIVDLPSQSLAERAVRVLQELGETVTLPPKAAPVRYLVKLNGRPVAEQKLEFSVKYKDGGSISTSVKTNAEGLATVSRDYFLDKNRSAERVSLGLWTMNKPDSGWFEFHLPPPGGGNDVIPADVVVGPFTLLLPLPSTVPRREKDDMSITMRFAQTEKDAVGSLAAVVKLPVKDKVEFVALAPGLYHVDVQMPGAARWSGQVEVASGGSFTVPLVPGHNVRFQLALPKEWKVVTPGLTELWRNGERVFDYQSFDFSGYAGVPAGDYRLRLLSSREFAKRSFGSGPANAREYEAAEVAFTVSADSPFEIDLGLIEPGKNRP